MIAMEAPFRRLAIGATGNEVIRFLYLQFNLYRGKVKKGLGCSMSEEKRKTNQTNKIVPMPTAMNDQEQDQVDSLILERLDREADALEEELNNDPSLAGVSLSSDFLNVIIGKLKEEGLWEEDEEMEKIGDSGEKENGEERGEEAESRGGKRCEEEVGDKEGKEDLEEINDLEGQDSKENDASMTQEDLDRLYQMLPEQDRRAMEMGRRVEKRKEKRRRRFRRWGMPVGVAASLMVLVCGVGMSSEANREWLMQTRDVILKNLGFKISTNFTDVESILRSKDIVEQEALKNVKEKMNILAPCFVEVSDGFEFLNYEITPDESEATMFYSYQDRIITVKIYKIGNERVAYTGVDDNAAMRDTLDNLQKVNIKIWEINLNFPSESYLAEAEYEGGYYIISGIMSLDEVKKLAQSIIFL